MDPVQAERERCLKILAEVLTVADRRGNGQDGELTYPAAVALREAEKRIKAGH